LPGQCELRLGSCDIADEVGNRRKFTLVRTGGVGAPIRRPPPAPYATLSSDDVNAGCVALS
jgi:hypothetical protein